MDDSLHARGKVMEDLFFAEQDRKLIDDLKKMMQDADPVGSLASASGISDTDVLESLSQAGITAESLTSVSLIPLVSVAWADQKMEPAEKEAILKGAAEAGIQQGSASFELLSAWLTKQPGNNLLESWKEYIGELKGSLEPVAFNQLKVSVIGKAKSVAESAGGFLGLGTVSEAELSVINDLESAFE
ncbi:MAG: hypothetical protein AAF939_19610 [Planctomycetota bacterium]